MVRRVPSAVHEQLAEIRSAETPARAASRNATERGAVTRRPFSNATRRGGTYVSRLGYSAAYRAEPRAGVARPRRMIGSGAGRVLDLDCRLVASAGRGRQASVCDHERVGRKGMAGMDTAEHREHHHEQHARRADLDRRPPENAGAFVTAPAAGPSAPTSSAWSSGDERRRVSGRTRSGRRSPRWSASSRNRSRATAGGRVAPQSSPIADQVLPQLGRPIHTQVVAE